jgi:hypothetical protein
MEEIFWEIQDSHLNEISADRYNDIVRSFIGRTIGKEITEPVGLSYVSILQILSDEVRALTLSLDND